MSLEEAVSFLQVAMPGKVLHVEKFENLKKEDDDGGRG